MSFRDGNRLEVHVHPFFWARVNRAVRFAGFELWFLYVSVCGGFQTGHVVSMKDYSRGDAVYEDSDTAQCEWAWKVGVETVSKG